MHHRHEPAPGAPSVGLYLYFKSGSAPQVVLRALRATDCLLQSEGWPAASIWHKAPRGAPDTWMTVHAPQPAERIDGLLAAFDAAASATGLATLIEGMRQAERFERCDASWGDDPCA